MNLLQETIEAIKKSGHAPGQIIFIGSEESGHQCTWAEFQLLANIEYDDGYGSAKVACDLVVVFSDGAKMWRGEFNGSEKWEYSTPFVRPKESKKISALVTTRDSWDSLEEINN